MQKEAAGDPKLRDELDAVLQELKTVALARDALPETDRQWFADTLSAELEQLGNRHKFEAVLTGSGTIVQGEGNIVANEGGVAIGGSVTDSVISTGPFYQMQGNVYLGQPAKGPAEALAIYRSVLLSACRHLPLRGVDIGASDPAGGQNPLELAQVYIDLDTKTPVPLSKEEKKRRQEEFALEEHDTRPLGALEATSANRRLVILGDPGSGKSTFVNHLAICLAAPALEPAGNWRQRLSC